MTADVSLFELISSAAKSGGELTILGREEETETRSFSRLVDEAERAAAVLHAGGFRSGDRLAAVARTTFDFVVTTLATWRLGGAIVPLPFPPRFVSKDIRRRQVQQRIDVARPTMVLLQEGDPEVVGSFEAVQSSALTGSEAPPDVPLPAPDSPAVVQFTSGSTSDPRGIVLSHSAVAAQSYGLRDHLGLDDPNQDHFFSWLPLYHDLGFIACLWRSFVIGIPVTFLPTDIFLTDPARWILGMSRCRATISAAPNFAFGLAARQIEAGLPEEVDLSSVKAIAMGGEANSPRTIERFLSAAVPLGLDPGALLSGYGLAESTCVVTVPTLGSGVRMDHVSRADVTRGVATSAPPDPTSAGFVSVGPPLAGTEVRVVEDGGEAAADRVIGEIQTRGPCLMLGYLDDPAASDAVMKDGWLMTGDRGYMVDGELYVTGRIKDLIIIKGQNYYAEDVEQVVLTVDAVRPGGCVAFGVSDGSSESLVVAAETKLTENDELIACRNAIKKALWSSTGLSAADVILLPPGTVPKTSSGKLQRGVARHLYDEGLAQQVALLTGVDA